MKKSRLLLLLLGVGMVANSIAAPPQVPITVTVDGEGTVMSEPEGITCLSDSTCVEDYKKGTNVTLTADPSSSFVGWDGACAGTDPICVSKVTAPTFVIAMFGAAPVVYPAPVSQTGQTRCWDTIPNNGVTEIDCDGTGQDGEHQAGIPWPNPRFTPNNDGTVTDNLTGLIWLQNANCFGGLSHWDALIAANSLAAPDCGLSDGSVAGEWRLPNIKEYLSLVDFSRGFPALPALHPFLNVSTTSEESTYHSSSPAVNAEASSIMFMELVVGTIGRGGAQNLFLAWPVKGGL